jgi:hypothetical protein
VASSDKVNATLVIKVVRVPDLVVVLGLVVTIAEAVVVVDVDAYVDVVVDSVVGVEVVDVV